MVAKASYYYLHLPSGALMEPANPTSTIPCWFNLAADLPTRLPCSKFETQKDYARQTLRAVIIHGGERLANQK